MHLTRCALVLDVQVRLEVLAARLRDRVDRRDEQCTILPPVGATASVSHVTRDVSVAAERVCVLGRDTTAGGQATVERATDDDHVTRIAGRGERFRRAEDLCVHDRLKNRKLNNNA